jgi:hypothetical protein
LRSAKDRDFGFTAARNFFTAGLGFETRGFASPGPAPVVRASANAAKTTASSRMLILVLEYAADTAIAFPTNDVPALE